MSLEDSYQDEWPYQQQLDDEHRRYEVTEVLRLYQQGLTSEEGLKVLCRECGISISELAK